MKIALISDIHGNLDSLQAVHDDIEAGGADRTICLGDVATLGPAPREVLGFLRERKIDCIMGNHDEYLLGAAMLHKHPEPPIIEEAVEWCRANLLEVDFAFLKTFSPRLRISMGGDTSLVVFHGSPESNMEDLLATTPASDLDAHLSKHPATVLAGGHTHVQMLRQHKGTLLVNPGSVGMPFEEFANHGPPIIQPYAEYALVKGDASGVSVELKRVPVSRAKLRASVDAWAPHLALRNDLLKRYDEWESCDFKTPTLA